MLGSLKKHLAGKRFVTEADVKQAVTSWLQAVENTFFCAGLQAIVLPQGKYLNANVEYVKF